MAKPLPAKQAAFVQEYVIDLNATAAADRAGYSDPNYGRQLLTNPNVAAAIEKALAERAERVQVTADDVLRQLWLIAGADPTELSRVRVSACRHCHGKDHQYQWMNEAEYAAALRTWEYQVARAEEKEQDAPPRPSDAGGYGYHPSLAPNAECPACMGDGKTEVLLADSESLSEGARALYAGAKYTQTGIEVKTKDQLKALELVGKHLGMFTDRLDLTSGGQPLKAYIGFDPEDV